MVGVNKFALEDEKIEIPILKIDPKVEKEQKLLHGRGDNSRA